MRSAHDLLTSYGKRPTRGASSVYGSFGWTPYALSEDARTNCFIFGLRRAASRSAHVPAMFVSNVEVGLRLATGTVVCAARWSTVSTSYSPRTRSRRVPSRTSPRTILTRLAAFDPKSSDSGTQ